MHNIKKSSSILELVSGFEGRVFLLPPPLSPLAVPYCSMKILLSLFNSLI